MEKLHVLVADDSEELRDLVGHCLQSLGHTVTSVETGRQAISLLKTKYFDLVVTDVIMPDADGIEVISEAKKRYPSTRIVVMTGGGEVIDPAYCVKLAKTMGAHVAILKPFKPGEFIEAVRLALN
jgi:CheY-like chemotaxis protein